MILVYHVTIANSDFLKNKLVSASLDILKISNPKSAVHANKTVSHAPMDLNVKHVILSITDKNLTIIVFVR